MDRVEAVEIIKVFVELKKNKKESFEKIRKELLELTSH